jgi:hypothetical protein
MNLDDLIQLQALKLKASASGIRGALLESAIEANKEKMRHLGIPLAPGLFDELEDVCQKLDLTKREFVEAAIIEAVDRANKVLQAVCSDMQERI